MGGVKKGAGSSINKVWTHAVTGEKLTKVMVVDSGKRRMVLMVKNGESYEKIPDRDCVLV
jgi:hypothetical protein